ncbi:MAG: hypothetical protein JXA25_04565 [Anaerolineales bacterium]|nr:hypothetical protein [Anaerolineales bacterium]
MGGEKQQVRRNQIALIGVGFISLFALVLILYATGMGMTLKSDSVRYLMGAENLTAGNGYIRFTGDGSTKPISVFPPGYSLLLSSLMLSGMEALTAARILGVFFYTANVFMTGWLVYRVTDKPILAGLASLMVMGYVESLRYHTITMSESPYIFFSLLSTILLITYIQKKKTWLLILMAASFGFIPIIRYLGSALLPVATLSILFFLDEEWRKRIQAAVFFSVTAILPSAIWFLHNARLTGSAANRTFAYHAIPLDKVAGYVDEVLSWFIPAVFQSQWRPRLSHLAIAAILAAAVFAYYQVRRINRASHSGSSNWKYQILPLFSFGYLILYVGILFFSSAFLDASLGGFRRYLIPALFFVVILLADGINVLFDLPGKWRVFGVVITGVWSIIIGLHFLETRQQLWDIRNNRGLGSLVEMLDDAAVYIADTEPSVIISNDIDIVYLLTGRYAFMIPIRINDYTNELTDDYSQQMQAYFEKMEKGAVLFLSGKLAVQDNYATYEELTNGMELVHSSFNVEIFEDPDYAP